MPRKGAQAAWRRIGTGLAGDAAGAKRVLRGGKSWRDSCPDKEARDAAASNSEEDRSRRARRRRIPERVEGRMEEKRAGKEHDAAKAENAAKNVGAGRKDSAAGKME